MPVHAVAGLRPASARLPTMAARLGAPAEEVVGAAVLALLLLASWTLVAAAGIA
jgi:hypothetical protein